MKTQETQEVASKFLVSISVWELSTKIDLYIADMVRQDGCQYCRIGNLHSANYSLKPRGTGEYEGNNLRYSFCCDQRSCRKRTSPVSLRFRRHGSYVNSFYEGVSSALGVMQGSKFRNELGDSNISDRTLRRWKKENAGKKPPGIHKFFYDNASLDTETLLKKLSESFLGDRAAFYAFMDDLSPETLLKLA